jgi:hypothetical protein
MSHPPFDAAAPPDGGYARPADSGLDGSEEPGDGGGATVDAGAPMDGGTEVHTEDGGPRDAGAQGHDSDVALSDAGDCAGSEDGGACQGVRTLLDLGHTVAIMRLRQSGDRILSQDVAGHWVFWNVSSRARILEGDWPFEGTSPEELTSNVDMAGATLAVTYADKVELRQTSDGSLLASLSVSTGTSTRHGLSVDGAYYWSADASGIKAWSRAGEVLLDNQGTISPRSRSRRPTRSTWRRARKAPR